jgi:hypothetical protein
MSRMVAPYANPPRSAEHLGTAAYIPDDGLVEMAARIDPT